MCVALAIQHAKRIRRIVLSTVICLAVQYFPQYLSNDFRRKKNYWT